MPSTVSRRRVLAAGLSVLVVASGAATTALPAAAQERPAPGLVKDLGAAVRNGTSALERLPRGSISRGPAAPASHSRTAPAPVSPPRASLTAVDVSRFDVRFVNTSGSTWTEPAKAAFLAAVDVWERTVESPVPIVVEATARADMGAGVLGSAGPAAFLRNEGTTVVPESREPTAAELRDDVFEPVALHSARIRRDALPATTSELNPDIEADFNPNLSGLYLGTDGRPGSTEIDFRTVVLHEIGHGLGLVGTARVVNGEPFVGDTEVNLDTGVRSGVSFDQFAYATSPAAVGNGGAPVLSLRDGSPELAEALTGDSLYWSGQLARTAAGGGKVRLYAPRLFEPGSSFSHLDEATYAPGTANGLMTPFLAPGESHPQPGQVAMGLLADMGYAVPALAGARYTALDPVRVLDSRTGKGVAAGRVGPGGVLDLQVTGRDGVPSTATAVVLNVTGVQPSRATDVRVYPTPVTPTPTPVVSNLNLAPGVDRANLVTVPIGNNGRVRLRNQAGSVDLVADLAGFYAPAAASTFTPLDPSRVLDTRKAIGTATTTPVQGGKHVDLQVTGAGGVPVTATAVAMTVTAVTPTQATDIRVFPVPVPADLAAPPLFSNINATRGAVVPNVAVVKLDAFGRVRLRNSAGDVHLLADVAGYYDGSSAGALFRPVTPVRVLDTRSTGRVGPGQAVPLRLGGVARVPSLARAAVLNVTGVAPTALTDVRVYPASATTVPTVSNLNLVAGQTAADLVVVKLGGGGVRLRNQAGSTHLLTDVSGWFGPPS